MTITLNSGNPGSDQTGRASESCKLINRLLQFSDCYLPHYKVKSLLGPVPLRYNLHKTIKFMAKIKHFEKKTLRLVITFLKVFGYIKRTQNTVADIDFFNNSLR